MSSLDPMRLRLCCFVTRLYDESRPRRSPLQGHYKALRRIFASTSNDALQWALADYVDCAGMHLALLEEERAHTLPWKRNRIDRRMEATRYVVTTLRDEVLRTTCDFIGDIA